MMARVHHRGEVYVMVRNRISNPHRGAAKGLYWAQIEIAD
jgi:hypothetical protein